MNIHQFYTGCLAQASYYVESDGVAAIIDPLRDVEPYLEMAQANNAAIRYVLVTHFHADFVSGHLELADRTGAEIVFGPQAVPDYPARIATDRENLPLGSSTIRVLHTPGHTIESACFLLVDEKGIAQAVFTGDTLFVGDVGRPDLLSGNLDARDLAGRLYDSVHSSLAPLADGVLVYPGHGAGSACGKNLGSASWTTIGEQRLTNPVFLLKKEAFVNAIVDGQPAAPAYFFRDAAINKQGCEHLDAVLERSLKPLSVEAFRREMALGALVLDTRKITAAEHRIVTRALHIGLDGQFAVWAGALLSFDRPLLIVADPGTEQEVITRLSRIGVDHCLGYLDGGMHAWETARGPVSVISSIRYEALNDLVEAGHEVRFLDVRNNTEFEAGHVNGALHIPLDELRGKLHLLDKDHRYAVYCAGGYRSLIAVSLLLQEGFSSLYNITGGYAAIKTAFTLPHNNVLQ
jgi:hydroxyacylglutathione hydrolase